MFPQWLSTLYFALGSLMEPGVHWLDWLISKLQKFPVPAFPVLNHRHTQAHLLSHGRWGSELGHSRLHTGTLPTKPSPQSPAAFFEGWDADGKDRNYGEKVGQRQRGNLPPARWGRGLRRREKEPGIVVQDFSLSTQQAGAGGFL